jgi:hypothetical protein
MHIFTFPVFIYYVCIYYIIHRKDITSSIVPTGASRHASNAVNVVTELWIVHSSCATIAINLDIPPKCVHFLGIGSQGVKSAARVAMITRVVRCKSSGKKI